MHASPCSYHSENAPCTSSCTHSDTRMHCLAPITMSMRLVQAQAHTPTHACIASQQLSWACDVCIRTHRQAHRCIASRNHSEHILYSTYKYTHTDMASQQSQRACITSCQNMPCSCTHMHRLQKSQRAHTWLMHTNTHTHRHINMASQQSQRACITSCQNMPCSCTHTYTRIWIAWQSVRLVHALTRIHTCISLSHAYIQVCPCRSSSVSIKSVHTYEHTCIHAHIRRYMHHLQEFMQASALFVRTNEESKNSKQNSLFMDPHIHMHEWACNKAIVHTLCSLCSKYTRAHTRTHTHTLVSPRRKDRGTWGMVHAYTCLLTRQCSSLLSSCIKKIMKLNIR